MDQILRRYHSSEISSAVSFLLYYFSNLFSDFPQKRTVGKSKDRFLGVKNRFWIPRFIGNPKSLFKNLNPDFSMKTSSLKFGISGFCSLDEPWAVGPQFSREAQDRLEMAPNDKITMCHW